MNFNEINLDEIDTSEDPPFEEPQRQYYFMAKCREWVRQESKRLGRPLFCITRTFGCQMNFKDSEKLSGILEIIGYKSVDTEMADLVVYNTCTVRENANTRVYGRIGYLGNLKKKNPSMRIALCGCMMQEPQAVENIRQHYRFVDIIFGTHNIYKLAELLYTRLTGGRMVIDVWKDTDRIVEELPSNQKYSFKAGVNIMYGCNNFCSYCIVPYVRGRERSRKPEDIIEEIRRMAQSDVKEIMLLGQNVNSYGKTLEKPISFAELLRRAEEVEGIERIRFMTSHPKDLSDELIDTMAASKKVCHHLHLPVQSGSSRILKQMNRRYTKEDYLRLVEKIRDKMPDIALTTDIIVGFPGETEEDFSETLNLCERVRFDSAYTFLYSKRTGTPAAAMDCQVDDDIAKERFDRLLKVIGAISAEKTAEYEGKTVKVLVEEINSQDSSLVTGRLDNNLLVHFKGGQELVGSFVNVILNECRGFYFLGESCKD